MFDSITNYRLLVYGTGKLASELILRNDKLTIVGVLDRYRFEGDFYGIPILCWEDIDENTADAIIIASAPENIKEVYFRIRFQCRVLGLEIHNYRGMNLDRRYADENYIELADRIHKCNAEELKSRIQKSDVISFDLFDTLIMRKVLEPTDIFDLVGERLKKAGSGIATFKKKRRHAESLSVGKDIHEIYRVFGELYDLSPEQSEVILQTEIQCEKDCLVRREPLVEAMERAIAFGKQVVIVSDMYLTSEILRNILDNLQITGYDKIYVSCEHGKSKASGLFDIVKKDYSGKHILHIGDDDLADIKSALDEGIESFWIPKAYEMIKISGIRRLLAAMRSADERRYVGLCISELFNNPFVLNENSDYVSIHSIRQLNMLAIVPIITVYMSRLLETVRLKSYRKILLTTRDGYLFYKLLFNTFGNYTTIPKEKVMYLKTSRRIAIWATIWMPEVLQEFVDFYISDGDYPQKTAANMFGELIRADWENLSSDQLVSLIRDNRELIISHSKVVYEAYVKYLQSMDICEEDLFCELNSTGTVHHALNRMLQTELDGFYMQWAEGPIARDLKVESLYNDENMIGEFNQFLELLLSSPEPSIKEIKENGDFTYMSEPRGEEEIKFMEFCHVTIEGIIKEIWENCEHPCQFSAEFAEVALSLLANFRFTAEAGVVNRLKGFNDMANREVAAFRV